MCFYLQEVETRRLYLRYGFASTVDYARESLGFEDRKTRSLLHMAERFEELPRLKKAFRRGDIPWTKAREVVKVATPKTEAKWLDRCNSMSNRQLEQEVKRKQPPTTRKSLFFVLEGRTRRSLGAGAGSPRAIGGENTERHRSLRPHVRGGALWVCNNACIRRRSGN